MKPTTAIHATLIAAAFVLAAGPAAAQRSEDDKSGGKPGESQKSGKPKPPPKPPKPTPGQPGGDDKR
jgi:hypothetical protein